ncbi:MAG: hypothetical protein VSS75_029925, partial [Candidatus Parabeggiatoa sp.]|nr:hypothetical protein [Candidatus Parabeggiatoa sp.]
LGIREIVSIFINYLTQSRKGAKSLCFRSNFSFRAKSFAKLLARTIGVKTGRIPKKSHYQSQSGLRKINLERKPSQNKFCTERGPKQNKFCTPHRSKITCIPIGPKSVQLK